MSGAFAQAALDQYCRDGMDLFQIPSLGKQFQFTASLRANKTGVPVQVVYEVKRKSWPTQS